MVRIQRGYRHQAVADRCIEFVRDARHRLTERGHFLRLQQLVIDVARFVVELLAVARRSSHQELDAEVRLEFLLSSLVLASLRPLLGLVIGIMRLSGNWLMRNIALAFIEFVRGVPLITVLFMASVMLPLLVHPPNVPDIEMVTTTGLPAQTAVIRDIDQPHQNVVTVDNDQLPVVDMIVAIVHRHATVVTSRLLLTEL